MLHLLLTALLLFQSPEHVDSGPIREAEKAPQEDWLTRALHYMEFNPETLEELVSKDYALSQGDMMLLSDRNAVASTWPTLKIPYLISLELAGRTGNILSAMAMVSEHTCVSFHQRTSETNYLHFINSKGCASYVGFIGGEQTVFVGPTCIVGNIVHEILHALGFYHEHTRTDREQYIKILSHNIMAGMERNFKMEQGQTFGLRYDITSIMHYGRGFFSANGQPTIVPKGVVKDMGQRVKMTKMDIERVRHLYSCDTTKKEMEKESGGVEKKEDANKHVLGHVSANKPEEGHTSSTSASPSASLQNLTAATGGHNNTSTEKA